MHGGFGTGPFGPHSGSQSNPFGQSPFEQHTHSDGNVYEGDFEHKADPSDKRPESHQLTDQDLDAKANEPKDAQPKDPKP